MLYTSTDAKGLLHMLDKPYKPVIEKEKNKQTLKITSTSLFTSAVRKPTVPYLAANDTYPMLYSQGHSISRITKKVYSILV